MGFSAFFLKIKIPSQTGQLFSLQVRLGSVLTFRQVVACETGVTLPATSMSPFINRLLSVLEEVSFFRLSSEWKMPGLIAWALLWAFELAGRSSGGSMGLAFGSRCRSWNSWGTIFATGVHSEGLRSRFDSVNLTV